MKIVFLLKCFNYEHKIIRKYVIKLVLNLCVLILKYATEELSIVEWLL